MGYIEGVRNSNGVSGAEGDLAFETTTDGSTTEKLRIRYDGNVGIGTTTPNARVEINSGANGTTTITSLGALGGTGTGNVTVASTAGWPASGVLAIRNEAMAYTVVDGTTLSITARGLYGTSPIIHFNGNTLAFLKFIEGAGSATWPNFSITSAGSVGIGGATPNPTMKLDVGGHIQGLGLYGTQVLLSTSTETSMGQIGGASNSALSVVGGGNAASYLNLKSTSANGTTDYIRFGVGNNGATEAMRIINSGNVGIGISPSYTFHAQKAVAANWLAGFVNSNTGGGSLYVGHGTGEGAAVVAGSGLGASSFSFKVDDAGGTRLWVQGDGNVGIGTTSANYKLHVVGSAGLSTGTAWTNASDIRLKDLQGDYEYGLDEVLKLHTVRFSYKKDNPLGLPATPMTGFIAQEVREVIPDAVKENENGFLELNVDPIHWAVVNAIREFYEKWSEDRSSKDREIAALKNENAEIKKQLELLHERLSRLENR
jgi:hypothetical protein